MGLEYLWRGRSHGSMFLAGGTCFLLLGKLMRQEPKLPLIPRVLLGSVVITAVELAAGPICCWNFFGGVGATAACSYWAVYAF